MDAEFLKNLLIAMNLSPELSREAACRLGAAVPEWLGTTPERVTEVSPQYGVKPRFLRAALRCARDPRPPSQRERTLAQQHGASLITRLDDDYPRALFDLDLPPPVLYVRGRLPGRPAISIVGSRKTDPYGIEVAESFSSELSASGLAIVSGLALGVDSAAHRGCLAADGQTVAVAGCGVDVDYPRSNRLLAQQIPSHGAIVSEFPIGTQPEPRNFPVRNRIIAALGSGTLVVRGTPRSGSLITAGAALTLGRLVWAIPGNIFDSRSMGPNCLIRDGAHPVQTPTELIETLPTSIQARLTRLERSDEQLPDRQDLAKLLQAIPPGSVADQSALLTATGLAVEKILGLLMELEIGGYLKRYPGPAWGRSGSPP